MPTNTIYLQDCLETLKLPELTYDYVITSPPDLDELGLGTDGAAENEYYDFLHQRLTFNPKNNVVTIINRNRKMNSTIYQKDQIFRSIMHTTGWVLKSHKIWVRSWKANMYRFNYSHIQTWKRGKCSAKDTHLPDAFFVEVKPHGTYVDNFPIELISPFIETYCPAGGTVFDPFIGSGSTAEAANKLDRNCIGSEIVPEVHKLALDRLNKESSFD